MRLVMEAAEADVPLMMPSFSPPATYILVLVREGHTKRSPPTPVAFSVPATLAALVGSHLGR